MIPSRALTFQNLAEATWLRAAVAGGGTAVLGQDLTGMGGVGKTQLAAAYARTAWQHGSLDVHLPELGYIRAWVFCLRRS
ncbi:hypothetical protein [Streptomyces sp. NBC_01276]|uniref:hypothetical protein n=1 Tax=Streptomyces sp. NBC_01276 TaxID=2903808 RepID=UPI00352F8A90